MVCLFPPYNIIYSSILVVRNKKSSDRRKRIIQSLLPAPALKWHALFAKSNRDTLQHPFTRQLFNNFKAVRLETIPIIDVISFKLQCINPWRLYKGPRGPRGSSSKSKKKVLTTEISSTFYKRSVYIMFVNTPIVFRLRRL